MGLVIVLVALTGCKSAERTPVASVGGLYSKHIEDELYDITFTEIERADNYSVARIALERGPSVGSSMFLMRCWFDIASIRGFEYFMVGKEWEEDDSYFSRVFFTHNKETPLKELLGDDYSQETQEVYDDSGYTSVEELKALGWEAPVERGLAPASP